MTELNRIEQRGLENAGNMNIKVGDLRPEQFKMQASQRRGDSAAGTRFSAQGREFIGSGHLSKENNEMGQTMSEKMLERNISPPLNLT